jgi:uncharacterized protein (TIGR02444 family)
MTDSSQNLWDFSLQHYARHDVPRLCLMLQDDHGFDVNLLLFTAWLTRRMNSCPPELLGAALDLSDTWRSQVVSRLRAARRWMKQVQPQELIGRSGDFHCPDLNLATSVSQLREQIKAAELSAEREQQQLLQALAQQWLENLPPNQGPQAGRPETTAAAATCSDESREDTAASVLATWQQLHQQMHSRQRGDGANAQTGANPVQPEKLQHDVKKLLSHLARAMFCPKAET